MAKKKSRWQKFRQDALALWDERFHSEEELSHLHRFLNFWVLVLKSFIRNRCPLRASALSYTTLLALIPLLAVAMSVTTSLLKKEGKDQIEHFIETFVSKMVPPAEGDTNAPPLTALPITNQQPENAPDVVSTNSAELVLNPSLTNLGTMPFTDTNNISSKLGLDKDVNDGESRLTAAQKKVAEQIYGFVQNVQSGPIAGVGMLLIIYAAIQMLRQIETTFNDIWGVTRGRSWRMCIAIYWTTITLGPLVLIGVFGLASGPHLQSTQKFLMEMPGIGALTFKLLPLLLLWAAFTLFYKTVPNIKVRFTAAMVGGLVGGTAWHVNNLLAFLFVSRVVTYSKMYGALGMLPVFMLGLYLSWAILLFGAQVAYAFQNRALYVQERIAENVNQRGREFVALRLMTCIGQRFQRGLRGPTSQEMSEDLCIPSRLVQQVLQTLIAAHLVIEVSGADPAYTPGRPLEQINAHHILQAMRARGQELLTRNEPVREEVYGEFARIQEAEKQISSTITMLALVHRAEARLELAPLPANEKEAAELKTLVPIAKPDTEPILQVVPPIETPATTEPIKPEPSVSAEIPQPAEKKPETVSHQPKPIAGPMGDEERDFPL